MKKIIITGGSGLIGRSLSDFLFKEGHQVSWLSRKQTKTSYQTFLWNTNTSAIDSAALSGKDVLIQLAGSYIAKWPWTKKSKNEIINSRIEAIRTLYGFLKKHNLHIPQIIQASAIGYYGNRGSELLSEQTTAGKDGFLTEVCKIWESEASCLKEFTDHFTIIRTGFYLSPEGGIWPNSIQSRKFGFLVYFGDGSQYYSWIHYLDYNRAISFIIHRKLNGIINLTAPQPASNKDLIFKINHGLRKQVFQFGVPVFALKLILGELSESVLSSAYVSPQILMENGFEFKFEQLEKAIGDLMKLEKLTNDY